MKTNTHAPTTTRRSLLRNLALSTLALAATSSALAVETPSFTGTIQSFDGKNLNVLVYRPTAQATYPAMIFMHGSTGMWSNKVPNGTILSNLDYWATWCKTHRVIGVFVDSFTNRLPGTAPANQVFQDRRPAEDTAVDDAACSPAWLRPKDAYTARAWLVSQAATFGVNTSRIGLMGFSQGAESVLSAVVDESVTTNKPLVTLTDGTTSQWAQEKLYLNGEKKFVAMPAPVFHPANQNHFRIAIAYYPGCGFYNYWNKLTVAQVNEYMPHCPTLVLHGTEDNFWKNSAGVTVSNFVEKSRLQALNLGMQNNTTIASLQNWMNLNYSAYGLSFISNAVNPMTHVLLPNAHHSFDLYPNFQGANASDGDAQEDARAIVSNWLMTYLHS